MDMNQLAKDAETLQGALTLGMGELLSAGKANLADAATVHGSLARVMAALGELAQLKQAAVEAEKKTGDAGSASPAPAAA